jgi:hypothetical protein
MAVAGAVAGDLAGGSMGLCPLIDVGKLYMPASDESEISCFSMG